MFLIFLVAFLLCSYILLMIAYLIKWHQIKLFQPISTHAPTTTLSVVIAARNEEHCISDCIQSIVDQNYPKDLFEIIVVDDFSTDQTALKVSNFAHQNVRLIRLEEVLSLHEAQNTSFKKRALTQAIASSNATLIVCTDADCYMEKDWLLTIALFYELHQPDMIVAPVVYKSQYKLVEFFQSLDFLSMQGITAATVYANWGVMCNGANLAYKRATFNAVKGFEQVEHIISGDDYLLQYKFKRHNPKGVMYLKSDAAIVTTYPQKNWKSFIHQRIRWASKMGAYKDIPSTLVLSLVFLLNFTLLLLTLMTICSIQYLVPIIIAVLIKCIFELIFLYPVARFFNQSKLLYLFPFLQFLHIFYIVAIAIMSRYKSFEWKGRLLQQQ